MGAIYACQRDNNQQVTQPMGWELSLKVGNTYVSFIPLYCDQCKTITMVSSKDVKQDSGLWRYV